MAKKPLVKSLSKPEDRKTSPAETMNEALIASIGEGLVIVNEYGIITQVNQSASDILGFAQEELVGNWLPKAVRSRDEKGEEIPPSRRPIVMSLMTGKPFSAITYYVRKDDSTVPVYGTASPFIVNGRPRGAVIVFRDVSREMQIEKAKDEFVSLASHQLRTPLTSIRLITELLQDQETGKLNARQKDYLEKIMLVSEQMSDLIADFLTISRMELGEIRLNIQVADLKEVVGSRVEELQPVAEASSVELTYTATSRPIVVPIDVTLLSQAIHNLLTNAIRYSKDANGKVKVTLKKTSKDYQIIVKDNGIGIPENLRGRVFERFFRGDNAVRAQGEGTGLGLYLVKSIMESSGGKIWYESREGKGTSFYLSIPLKGMKLLRQKKPSPLVGPV